MRHRPALLRSMLGGAVIALAVAATALGYAGQVAVTVTATGPGGPQACGTPLTVSATILDAQNAPIEGQPVAWTFGSGAIDGDTILDDTTTTNASGVASTRVQFACTEAHQVVIVATADDAQGQVTISTSGESLPRTDTALVPAAPTETPTAGIVLAALAVLAGSLLILRRFSAERR